MTSTPQPRQDAAQAPTEPLGRLHRAAVAALNAIDELIADNIEPSSAVLGARFDLDHALCHFSAADAVIYGTVMAHNEDLQQEVVSLTANLRRAQGALAAHTYFQPPMPGVVRSIGVDFDGVIHDYWDGWRDGSIYGGLMPGAAETLRILMDRYAVFVHTARAPEQVVPWLEQHGMTATSYDGCTRCNGACCIGDVDLDDRPTYTEDPCRACKGSGLLDFWDRQDTLLVTNRKLCALLYVDDRALRFTSWTNVLALVDPEAHNRLLSSGELWREPQTPRRSE